MHPLSETFPDLVLLLALIWAFSDEYGSELVTRDALTSPTTRIDMPKVLYYWGGRVEHYTQ